MIWRGAAAKINLALVVGPTRPDGKHEVATLLQQVTLADRVGVEAAARTSVEGFAEDTIVAGALHALADAAGVTSGWRALIEKRIPVAAGLGGGSSDAAAALRLANSLLAKPLPEADLRRLAAATGADVPFFLADTPQLGTGDGSDLQAVELPQDYVVLLLLPHGAAKHSTAAVYAAFDERDGAAGFEARRDALIAAIPGLAAPADLAGLPPNDLASSELSHELRGLGAFRADVSGAGPTLYGLFAGARPARAAAAALASTGRTWLVRPRPARGRGWYRRSG